jgi:hypothetical protein
LGGQTKASGTGARNQDIDLLGQRFVSPAVTPVGGCLFDVWAAATETIFVELHLFSLKTVQKQGPLEATA